MSYSRQSILFISGLEKTVNENMLYQLFNEYPISYIKIAKDHQTRESFGYAFVGFKNHSKAEEAITKLNYSKLNKKTLRISWYNREPNNYRNHPEYNIFVKKIAKGVGHQEFHDMFSQFGNIVSAKLAEDEEGEMMGYGFVLYDSGESAEKAIKATHGMDWRGKKLFVSQFVKNKPKKTPRFNNIYVKNIPKSWSKEDIENFFSKYGTIGSTLVLVPDPNRLNSNLPEEKKQHILLHKFAFVCFKDLDGPAPRAVNEVPYYKISDQAYNSEIDRLIELLKTCNVEEQILHKGAAYLIDQLGNDINNVYTDSNLLNQQIQNFRKVLNENDGVYIVKDKTDRIECCQAQKKSERAKILKQIYEKIKRRIKEKYKFCNLYIKNLPDNFDDDALKSLFIKFGEIRSAKVVKKEFVTSYLGIKRSVKVFGFVCFFDPSQAREAKQKLDKTILVVNGPRLYVDYHQNKQERSEYLKLQMINKSAKAGTVHKPGVHPFMGPLPMRPLPSNFGPQMLRKFPPQTAFINPGLMGRPFPNMIPHQMQGQSMPQPSIPQMDPNARADYYGEKLFTKISSDPKFAQFEQLFSKIVGIFLDLDDNVLERLIHEDSYFIQQVNETIRLLTEKVGN